VNHDDAQAIAEVLRGNAEAYEPLVLKYQDRLFNSLMQVARSREEAEDVAQEAFVQAYVKLDTFQQHSTFYTWLYRIAFNLALSRRRRKRLEVSVEHTKEAAGLEPTDPGEAPEEQLNRSERQAQVHAALGRLSEEHRAILVLREMEGFPYETISEMLDLPVGTVRSRLHRARSQLRDELMEILEESSPPRQGQESS